MSGQRRMADVIDRRITEILIALLAVAVFLYSIFIAEQLLLGVLAVGLIVFLYGCVIVWRHVPWPAGSSHEQYFKSITAVLTAAVFLYGLFVVENLLLALLAAVTIVLIYVAWRATYAVWHYMHRSHV